MGLQDQIDSFQKMIFSHFRHSANNECRISSLVPLVKESWGIYRFITSMLRALYRSTFDVLNKTVAKSASQELEIKMRWSPSESDLRPNITTSANSITSAQTSST